MIKEHTPTNQFDVSITDDARDANAQHEMIEASGAVEAGEAETLSFTVAAEDADERFDSFLAKRVPGWSRTRIVRLIEAGDALLNGATVKSSRRVQTGEHIEIELVAPLAETRLVPENIPLEIIHEDEDLIVVDKPAGMVVHPGAGVHAGTLANALAYHFANLSKGSGAYRPGIVHRIDRDTSGLLVVAKTEAAHEHLAAQFAARRVFKSYVALVHGRVKDRAGRIEEPIGRDPHHRTRMSVVREGSRGGGGRSAISIYIVRATYDRFTLLDVEIKTGRTHQIRVHLAWLKHPVVGDGTYGTGRDQTITDVNIRTAVARLERHFLHAHELKFTHPRNGERLSFRTELPVELRELLARLAD